MVKKLKINTWTAIFNIINCVLFTISWFVIFGTAFSDAAGATAGATDGAAVFFYGMAWVGVVLNAICIYQSHKNGIKMTGGILGTIGSVCFGFTALLAFPAIVLLIISCVFLFQQHAAKNTTNTNAEQ
ncbi:transporter [Ligilactobacillus cholophilus]|uniref:transporter n=1 Tax=Ligilactobacillus cholophilus TaxID=3050131 RepID=UPI0025AF94A8|nr:transporter [Ligilactobacillus cholophilus]